MQGVFILCQKRELESLLDALEDWKGQGTITLYGTTPKAQDGFLVMHWMQPISPAFQEMQLKADPGIIDYVIYDVPSVLPQSPILL